MRMNALAIFFLVAAAIGGVAYVFVYPILSGEKVAERRRMGVARMVLPDRAHVAM